MDNNEAMLLTFVCELLHSRSPDWSVSVTARSDGGYDVAANHPASSGLVWEMRPRPVGEAVEKLRRWIESNDEVAIASAAPTPLSNPKLISGIRIAIQAFDWSNDEARAIAGALWDARVIRLDEAGWLAGYLGAGAPRQYHAFE